ncbi:activator-dependent family glycosyltransferase [Prauserella cavernicola]|uniref:Activator-dependent family glycosyltransferase n=1 Tax=Prauserella cavernicola TaxID=2800127 RepID=A0A934V8K3_9PSEU|nr:activator-dependent family glycosyltransferase [Prauserella cavernicola]MBK1787858.1 activator-dependent family glycosyltransferase [Prauserella cavernicola]
MNVLFVSYPEKTHFLPMVPVAWALRTAGHEVRVASQPGFSEVITQAGLTAVPVGTDRDSQRMLQAHPDYLDLRGPRAEDGDMWREGAQESNWEHLREEYESAVQWWHRMDNFPLIADLVDFARHWKPDLVVWEPSTYAGAIAAKACGAAHARLTNGPDVLGGCRETYLRVMNQQPPENRDDPLANWLGRYAREAGGEFTEDMATGHFTIEQLPGSLRVDADLEYVPVRYVPYGGPAVLPRWLWDDPPTRPRVALTLGTTATERFDGYSIDVRAVLDALAGLDVEVVATIPESEQLKLGSLPGNVRAVPFVPLHALVPTCSAVIHHAGFGTLCTTALHGVPQLILPWDFFDEAELADRVAEHGGGLVVHRTDDVGTVVRDSLVRILDEPEFAERARALSTEMRDLPTPNELVARLEELVTKYRGPRG